MLVDTHAHLTYPQFADEREDLIRRSLDAGVTQIVDVGTNAGTSREAVRHAEIHEGVFASVGIHPHDCESATDAWLEEIPGQLDHPRVVAVGETGLDFFRDYAPRDVQERLFRSHIAFALDSQLPLIIHSRGAEEQVVQILNEMGARDVGGVLHCFGGNIEQAARTIEIGFHLGFGGTITFKKSTSLEVALTAPQNRLLLETDSPYLAPAPFRGKRNEPAYVRQIAEFMAEASGVSLADLAKQTTNNAKRLFGLEA